MNRKLRFSVFALCLFAIANAGCKSLSGCSSCGAKAEPTEPAKTTVAKADTAIQQASFTVAADECNS